MKKIHALALTLVAVFAFGAISVASASAAEWLINGSPVATLTSTEGIGALVLGDEAIGLKMLCEAVLDGSVGPAGEDEITEILVGGVATSLTKPIKCEGEAGCASPAEAAAEGLPWHTKLTVNGTTIEDTIEKATYWSMCNVLGFLTEEECTVTNGKWPLKNGTSDVEVAAGTVVSPPGNCTVGGVEKGTQEFEGTSLTQTLNGATIAVS